MTILIGICGEIGSGKSTIADYLKSCGFDEYSFAKPVKDLAMAMGFTYKEVWGTQKEKITKNKYWGISGREFLQKFATQIGRELMPKIIPNMDMGKSNSPWIRLFEIYWNELLNNNGLHHSNLVVSDVRFPDEAKSIQEQGGYIIRIIRPGLIKNGVEHTHKSETNIDKIDVDAVIINDKSKEELFNIIEKLISNIVLFG